jgi:hypothetical protein
MWFFENNILRKKFCFKREEVLGGWRKVHSDELRPVFLAKCYSGDQIKKDKMGGVCETYGGEGKCLLYFGMET